MPLGALRILGCFWEDSLFITMIDPIESVKRWESGRPSVVQSQTLGFYRDSYGAFCN